MSDDLLTVPADQVEALDPITAAGPEPAPPPKRGPGRPRGSTSPRSTSKPAAKGAAPKNPGGRPSTHAVRATKVAALYSEIGGLCQFGAVVAPQLLNVGIALQENAGKLGEAWAQWADTSPRVAKMIDNATFGGAALGVLLAHLPIVMAAMQPADSAGLGDALGGVAGLFDFLKAPAAPAA